MSKAEMSPPPSLLLNQTSKTKREISGTEMLWMMLKQKANFVGKFLESSQQAAQPLSLRLSETHI